jgi:hypothetical protein
MRAAAIVEQHVVVRCGARDVFLLLFHSPTIRAAARLTSLSSVTAALMHRRGASFSALPSGLLTCLVGARVRVHVAPASASSSSSSLSASSSSSFAAAEGELAAVSPRGDVTLRGAALLAAWPAPATAAGARAPLSATSLQVRADAVRLVELLALPDGTDAGAGAGAALTASVARHMRALDAAAAAAAARPGARRFGTAARAPAALGPALGVASIRPAR